MSKTCFVIQPFDDPSYPRIPAVICGTEGSGKSTILRRLAIDLAYQNFCVLWINSFADFLLDFERLITQGTHNFLIIIEDWEKIVPQLSRTSFLHQLSLIKTVRLVIGDKSANQREYVQYSSAHSIFLVPTKDTMKILRKIITELPDWQFAAVEMVSNGRIYSTRLFMILFLIATEKSKEHPSTKDVIAYAKAKFKNIVQQDLKLIQRIFSSLPQTLHYCMHLLHETKPTAISWGALLSVMDYYNGDAKISVQLKDFNPVTPLCKILSYYLGITQISMYRNSHIFLIYFIHPLLHKELLEPLEEIWPPFDNNKRIEILDVLIKSKNLHSARGVYEYFIKKGNVFINANQQKTYFNYLKNSKSFTELCLDELDKIYNNIRQKIDQSSTL